MRTTLTTAIIAALCLVGIPSLALSQSLAEVAAKERKRREAQAKGPAKVITEDELAKGRRGAPPPDVAPVEDEEAAKEGASSGASGEQAEEEKSDEELRAEARADWDKRRQAAEEKVAPWMPSRPVFEPT